VNLIRKEPRVSTDPKTGATSTQHWDGRKDVTVKAKPVRVGRGGAGQ